MIISGWIRSSRPALASLVEGWPAEDASVDDTTPPDGALAQSLCERGVLTPTSASAPDATPTVPSHSLPAGDTEFMSWEQMSSRNVRAHYLFAFLLSMSLAFLFLKARSLQAAVLRLERRRHRIPPAIDWAKARECLSAFSYVRMFFYARRARCLFDSLVLMEFLALYGVHPQWVIGVRMRPFGAHSWVQHERWVLNGTPAFVRHFTPILVI